MISWILLLTSLFLPSAIPQGFISAGGSASITFVGSDSGTDQTGSSVTSVQTATGVTSATGWVGIVVTRTGNGAVTLGNPTVQAATGTCTQNTASNSTPLDSGGGFVQMSVCPITSGAAATKITCNTTSIPYVSCVVLYFTGLTGTADTGSYSSAYATGTTNDLGTSLFTTTHSATVVVACMTYAANDTTFTAGSIAGSSATIGKTSGNNSSGTSNDTGCEYRILSGTVSSANAALSLGASKNNLVVSTVAVF